MTNRPADPWDMAAKPCPTCPYLRSTPSGLWARTEYEKLPDYDNDEVFVPFACHQTNTRNPDAPTLVCRGWLSVHSQSIAARLAQADGKLTVAQVHTAEDARDDSLYASGQEAYEAGIAELDDPSSEARRKADLLVRRGRGAIFR